MSTRTRIIIALALVVARSAFAQGTPTSAPLYERTLKPGAAGANHVVVDSALLVRGAPFNVNGGAATGGLGDLRLHDAAAGRDVPYIFVWPTSEPPTWRGGRIIPVSPGKDTSGFEVDLGGVAVVDRVEIPTLPERFLKRVRLEGSGDRVRWTMLVAEGTLFNLPNEADAPPLRQTQLGFTPGAYRYLRLIWDDHVGPRLATPSAARARLAPRDAGVADSLYMLLSFDKRPGAARTSRYHLRLPATRLPIVAVELAVSNAQVLRSAHVTEPQLGAERVAPVQLGTAILRRTSLAEAIASNLRIPISSPTGAELDLVIDDHDNPPLDVHGIRMIFAPLPYIFFESASGAELRATYGTERRGPIVPPRYDLEALRDTVKGIAAASATWGVARETRVVAAVAPPSALYSAPGAPLDASGFAFARRIPSGSGLTAVRLDAAVLAHSRLDDVRILDARGRQVPYLLEILEEPTELALPALEPIAARATVDSRVVPDAATRTWYRLKLPHAGLPDASLRLSTSARVFSRDIGVIMHELRRDAASDAGFDRATSAAWTHDDPDTPAPALELSLGARLQTDSLFVLVNDGDNQKIALADPTLLLPSYRLRFFREPGSSLRLLYGHAELAAPRYDMALIAPRLLDASAEEVVAESERTSAVTFGRIPRLVFWGMLGVVVVVLLLLIARLVRNSPTVAEDQG
ncbi:MAG: hypothetical protein JWL61_3535 [Gemmatimonadetes bacterium]|nr:hypothetical protein [Gemmatimonadota bacterium]